MKKKDIINLIKAHYDQDELLFRSTTNDIARDFDASGDHQLAQYIMTFLSSANTFVPQAYTFESPFFKTVNTNTGALPLPTPIADDIKGIINAVNHHVGIHKFLFEGAPGTGKTESAKQVARLLSRKLYMVDFNSLIDSMMGQTAKNIAAVFNEINRMPAPDQAVILFDEIDAIALDRVNTNDLREMGRATSSVLQALDRVNEDVVVIATTNLYKQLDRAFIRRFDSVIDFDRYTQEDKLDIAGILLNNDLKKFKNASRDMKLVRKILNSMPSIPNPGELNNLLKVSLAFSDPDDPQDYLRRLYRTTQNISEMPSFLQLKKQGFTLREIGVLTGVSKSQVARELRGASDE
ncbi:AAA family ATPase [Lacticaseibacillus chiayiensis]|uniref:AAA family ATPase n=1 Tax=Lacticaseibacillus chiayiensis TaxID=2100821 RepID=A0A4Q1TS01_9LACO|nr:ATP-binding protein [Lacticaseibacillus chiayiensis]QVI34327.1 AAA family ATPase [Lacticaseibacillus chiayiensis]RXT20768.1 AAA family ATPase [Lacticaseibacillus chiayiensis]RXT58564.1 AAA family ATPase [Lacticaseibacillus chiayiensis]UYN56063.1 ATP-binding protein [Lacticaseibacillus chiayiensis]